MPESTPGFARLEPWLGGRRFILPVEMIPDPRSSAMYVAEMTSRIYRVDESTAEVRLVADLRDRNINAAGLRALALHPTASRAFVVVECPPLVSDPRSPPRGFDSELRAYDVREDGTFDLASESLVLRVNVPGSAHSVNTLRFGRDGKLYVSIGDGRTTRFEPDKLLGTILRIDVDGATPYSIPLDNPFAGDPVMRNEIYAYGFRNPWKFSFDRATGDLWAGDVGETRTEEINRVVAGGNYGWPLLEGTECHHNSPGCDAAGTVLPVFSYSHATGNSITGGYVYRGARIAPLVGHYVYADFQAGGLWALDLAAANARPVHLNAGEARPYAAAIAEGHDGELFVLDWQGGTIFALAPDTNTPERPPFPSRLSETDCFTGTDPARPSPRLVPYDVNVELWSDGAAKTRFLALPPGATLEAMPDGRIALPPGGLTIKTFFEDGRPIETRFLGRQGNGEWVAASYEWNAEGTDAFLLEEAKELTLPSGHAWTVPAPAQCFFCHQDPDNLALSLDWRQLDDGTGYDVGSDNVVARLADLGILRGAPPNVTLLAPSEGDAPLEARARSYLHANCSMCHRPGNTFFSLLDLRIDTPFEETNLCNAIVPGAPEESRISRRMHTRGMYPGLSLSHTQMPPVATHRVDPIGTALIDDWIRETTRCSSP